MEQTLVITCRKLFFSIVKSIHWCAYKNKKPKILNLKEFISEFLKFREDTVIKRAKYDLKKAETIGMQVVATGLPTIDIPVPLVHRTSCTGGCTATCTASAVGRAGRGLS